MLKKKGVLWEYFMEIFIPSLSSSISEEMRKYLAIWVANVYQLERCFKECVSFFVEWQFQADITEISNTSFWAVKLSDCLVNDSVWGGWYYLSGGPVHSHFTPCRFNSSSRSEGCLLWDKNQWPSGLMGYMNLNASYWEKRYYHLSFKEQKWIFIRRRTMWGNLERC